jgi:hypothetical protein
MAKGAATETTMGTMHSLLAQIYIKTLEKYERQLVALDTIPEGEFEAEMLEQLLAIQEPNPAMLSAISKFLKDNDIMYDSEDVDKLSSQERRLQELRANRGAKVVSLRDLPKADNA